MTSGVSVFSMELERAEQRAEHGHLALEAFSQQRAKTEPFSIEGWFSHASVAVDAYTKASGREGFAELALRDLSEAICLLGDVSTDLFHHLDGLVKWEGFHQGVLRIVSELVSWNHEANTRKGAPEFADAVALGAALTLRAGSLNSHLGSRFLINSASERFQTEAEWARWAHIHTIRLARLGS